MNTGEREISNLELSDDPKPTRFTDEHGDVIFSLNGKLLGEPSPSLLQRVKELEARVSKLEQRAKG